MSDESATPARLDSPRPEWAIRLKSWREAELLSQRKLARLLGEAADEHARAQLPGRESIARAVRYHEAGTHPPGPLYTELYCRVYGTTADDLFGEGEPVYRREFLGSSVSVAAMAMMPPQLVQLASGRRIGAELVGHLHVRTARLRRLDDYLGGADTYRLYGAEADATATLVEQGSCAEPTHRALLGILAEQAQIAGWAAFDAGWQAEARKWFTTSLKAAEDAGDGPLAANSLAFLAYQKVSAGRPACAEAEAVLTKAGEAGGSARALLLDRTAWIYAVEGDDREAERRLALAEDALAGAGAVPAREPDWAYWIDAVELDIMTGRCWTELHRPLRAVPALERALARYDDSHARDKALYLTWLAEAYLDAREAEQAATVATRALTLAQGVSSVRPLRRLGSIGSKFDRYAGLPAVAEFIDRLAAASRAPATPGTA